MADENTGSGDGQAPQSGGGASAGDILGGAENNGQTTAGGDTGNQTSVNEGGQQTQQNADWISGFEGEDLGWLQNRGLQGKPVDEALKNLVGAQRSAEKRFGVPTDRLLTMPADPSSEGAMDTIWKALGRPDEAAGYEIDRGDSDLTGRFADRLGETFHKAGLSRDQGKAVEKLLDDFFTEQFETDTAADNEAKQVAINALKDKWGGEDQFSVNIAIAKEAVKAAGATTEEIAALEDAFGDNGNAKVIEFFNRLGQKRGVETPFVDGDGSFAGLGATTPEAARAKMNEMKSDPEISKFLLENNPDNEHVKRYRGLRDLAARGMGQTAA